MKKSEEGFGGLLLLIGLAIYGALFAWYARTAIPHTTPTHYITFFWGLLHGFFIVPTLIYSWFAHGITIYQSPNVGRWYNIGYVLGIAAFFGGARSV